MKIFPLNESNYPKKNNYLKQTKICQMQINFQVGKTKLNGFLPEVKFD